MYFLFGKFKGPGSDFMQQSKGSGGAGDSNGENNGDTSEKSSDKNVSEFKDLKKKNRKITPCFKQKNESKEESSESASGTGLRGNFTWIGDNNCTAEIKMKSGKIFGKNDCP